MASISKISSASTSVGVIFKSSEILSISIPFFTTTKDLLFVFWILVTSKKNEILKSVPLYAAEDLKKVNFFKSLLTSLNYLIWGDA